MAYGPLVITVRRRRTSFDRLQLLVNAVDSSSTDDAVAAIKAFNVLGFRVGTDACEDAAAYAARTGYAVRPLSDLPEDALAIGRVLLSGDGDGLVTAAVLYDLMASVLRLFGPPLTGASSTPHPPPTRTPRPPGANRRASTAPQAPVDAGRRTQWGGAQGMPRPSLPDAPSDGGAPIAPSAHDGRPPAPRGGARDASIDAPADGGAPFTSFARDERPPLQWGDARDTFDAPILGGAAFASLINERPPPPWGDAQNASPAAPAHGGAAFAAANEGAARNAFADAPSHGGAAFASTADDGRPPPPWGDARNASPDAPADGGAAFTTAEGGAAFASAHGPADGGAAFASSASDGRPPLQWGDARNAFPQATADGRGAFEPPALDGRLPTPWGDAQEHPRPGIPGARADGGAGMTTSVPDGRLHTSWGDARAWLRGRDRAASPRLGGHAGAPSLQDRRPDRGGMDPPADAVSPTTASSPVAGGRLFHSFPSSVRASWQSSASRVRAPSSSAASLQPPPPHLAAWVTDRGRSFGVDPSVRPPAPVATPTPPQSSAFPVASDVNFVFWRSSH